MPCMNRLFLLLVLATAAATPAPGQLRPGASILLDSYAAIVNGKVITVGQVLAALQPAQERLAARYEGEEFRQKLIEEFNAIRDTFIESELILAAFEMQGGSVPDRAVEDHINSVIHDRFNNDRAALLKALAAERLTFAEWRKQMKDQFIIQVMRQREVSAKILLTPLDLQNAYERRRAEFSIPERVRLRTLSIPAKGQRPLAELRDRLRSGQATFEALADGATVQDDGEFIDLASINPAFQTAISGLDPDGISDPVEIGDTAYFVQLLERQPARIQPFEEVAPELERELRRAESERLNRIWMDSLRAKYHIQLFTHDLFAEAAGVATPPSRAAEPPSSQPAAPAAPPAELPVPEPTPILPRQPSSSASQAAPSEAHQPVFW